MIDALLDAMFPGAETLPRFSESGAQAPGDPQGHIAALAAEHAGPEINVRLKAMRKADPEAVATFTEAALRAYFAAPAVVSPLRGGPAELFPHARSLPEIDYDLLAPVLERGAPGDKTP